MDVNAHVALLGDERLARVEPDPHADGAAVESALRVSCGSDRIGRAREGHEEGVALRVDLDTSVALKRLTQQPPVLGEDARVTVTKLGEQPRRALDVGDEEGDRPAGQVAHGPIIRQMGPGY